MAFNALCLEPNIKFLIPAHMISHFFYLSSKYPSCFKELSKLYSMFDKAMINFQMADSFAPLDVFLKDPVSYGKKARRLINVYSDAEVSDFNSFIKLLLKTIFLVVDGKADSTKIQMYLMRIAYLCHFEKKFPLQNLIQFVQSRNASFLKSSFQISDLECVFIDKAIILSPKSSKLKAIKNNFPFPTRLNFQSTFSLNQKIPIVLSVTIRGLVTINSLLCLLRNPNEKNKYFCNCFIPLTLPSSGLASY